MGFVSAIAASNTFREKGIKFLTKNTVSRLFGMKNINTAYKLLQRLEGKRVIERLKGGLYLITGFPVLDFELANNLVQPSYVSFESALNFYSILSQFPYVITSATTKKTKKVEVGKKSFEYSSFAKELYWGFISDNGILIAKPEKAFLDTAYLVAIGNRALDLSDLDISQLDKHLIKLYTQKFADKRLDRLLLKLKVLT